MENDFNPEKVSVVLRCVITILTALLGFFSGIGTAAAANYFFV